MEKVLNLTKYKKTNKKVLNWASNTAPLMDDVAFNKRMQVYKKKIQKRTVILLGFLAVGIICNLKDVSYTASLPFVDNMFNISRQIVANSSNNFIGSIIGTIGMSISASDIFKINIRKESVKNIKTKLSQNKAEKEQEV